MASLALGMSFSLSVSFASVIIREDVNCNRAGGEGGSNLTSHMYVHAFQLHFNCTAKDSGSDGRDLQCELTTRNSFMRSF